MQKLLPPCRLCSNMTGIRSRTSPLSESRQRFWAVLCRICARKDAAHEIHRATNYKTGSTRVCQVKAFTDCQSSQAKYRPACPGDAYWQSTASPRKRWGCSYLQHLTASPMIVFMTHATRRARSRPPTGVRTQLQLSSLSRSLSSSLQ
jgi:hypothetical protein